MNRLVKRMSNPNQLYDDMERLNALYEELCWAHDDELVFTHENGRVIIYNKTQEQEQMNERAERINGWAAMIGVIAAMGIICPYRSD
jgi:transcriptional regulator with PAS, ATPase and Fis domain